MLAISIAGRWKLVFIWCIHNFPMSVYHNNSMMYIVFRRLRRRLCVGCYWVTFILIIKVRLCLCGNKYSIFTHTWSRFEKEATVNSNITCTDEYVFLDGYVFLFFSFSFSETKISKLHGNEGGEWMFFNFLQTTSLHKDVSTRKFLGKKEMSCFR